MSAKKKRVISILVLVIMLILSSAAGMTLSLLSFTPVRRANVFTFSDVSIEIIETEWGKLDDASKVLDSGQIVPKDPKIKISVRMSYMPTWM